MDGETDIGGAADVDQPCEIWGESECSIKTLQQSAQNTV